MNNPIKVLRTKYQSLSQVQKNAVVVGTGVVSAVTFFKVASAYAVPEVITIVQGGITQHVTVSAATGKGVLLGLGATAITSAATGSALTLFFDKYNASKAKK